MNVNFPQFEHILRSRSKSFGSASASQSQPEVSSLEKSKNAPGRSRQLFHAFRTLAGVYKIFLFSAILLVVIFLFLWPQSPIVLREVPAARPRHEPEITVLTAFHSLPTDSPSTRHKVPFVDRAILQRLADMEIFPDPDERPYFASSHPRPPMVTRVPEARKPLGPAHALPPDICGPTSTPCRFLFPLRIGEQESKARIHFMEILQLAQKLDRILVLPNVGKSRIGACFKSDFEMYYDLERLTEDLAHGLPTGRAATVNQHLFRRWVDAAAPSAQLSFLSAKQEVPQRGVESTTFSNEDVSMRVGSVDSDLNLPGCFAKLNALRLGAYAPLHIHLKPHAHTRSTGASIVDALTRPDIQAAAATPPLTDPAVLVLSWDLRYPIFPTTPGPGLPTLHLHYSPGLHALAAALAPPAPYAMVHWRMESVAPANLPQCAHALVDTLARLPWTGSNGVRTIWFASDYPYAVKSGTFRDVGPLHAEAVGILGDAFAEGGELDGWAVAELTDARLAALEGDWEPELLQDAGVRAIVDKIIGMRAALFVSGAPRCARTSSFTKQVLDERRAALGKLDDDDELPGLQNIVELFG
ncbi:hypothetical protein B0H19DRAFT_1375140 [Mycena capillaripes]|nr:hypothetical protein B0H19DRAFT_1375140 [Mycena capillaripes]